MLLGFSYGMAGFAYGATFGGAGKEVKSVPSIEGGTDFQVVSRGYVYSESAVDSFFSSSYSPDGRCSAPLPTGFPKRGSPLTESNVKGLR